MGKQGSVEEITLKPFPFSHPRKESERTITKKKSSSKGQLSKINTKFLSETKTRAGLSLCSAGINSNLISAPCSLTQLSKGTPARSASAPTRDSIRNGPPSDKNHVWIVYFKATTYQRWGKGRSNQTITDRRVVSYSERRFGTWIWVVKQRNFAYWGTGGGDQASWKWVSKSSLHSALPHYKPDRSRSGPKGACTLKLLHMLTSESCKISKKNK